MTRKSQPERLPPVSSRDKQWLVSMEKMDALRSIPHTAKTQRVINSICGVIFLALIVFGVLYSGEIIRFLHFK